MNSLEKEILTLLKALEEQGALKHLILIGSWATLFYKDYFKSPAYHPTLRTTDIDFLVPKKPPTQLNLSQTLTALGFLENYTDDGWITFHKPDLHVEFLWPRLGSHSDKVKPIPELGINARPLRFMTLLAQHAIECDYQGISLKLPHPAAYAIHKLIISERRLDKTKIEKDLQQAEDVLMALTNPNDLDLLKQILEGCSKKEQKAILEAIKTKPLLCEVLMPFLG